MNTYEMNLDLSKKRRNYCLNRIVLRQGDQYGTTIVADIYDHGVRYNTNLALTARFEMMLPDRQHYYRADATVTKENVDQGTSAGDVVLSVTIDEQYAAAVVGQTSIAYFALLQGNVVIASTEPIDINILRGATDGMEVAESYDNAIQNAIDAIPQDVADWLDDHPEATTTVQDGAVSNAKLLQNGGILSDVNLLKKITNLDRPAAPDWGDDGSRGVYYTTGELKGATIFNHTTYVDVSQFSSITYSRVNTTASSGTFGMAFYDSSQEYVSGERAVLAADDYGYTDSTIEVPATAKYARFTIFNSSSTVTDSFELTGMSLLSDKVEEIDAGILANEEELDGLFDITEIVSWSSGYITTSGTFSSNAQYNNFTSSRISRYRFHRILLTIPADRQCTVATYDPITRAFVARTAQLTDTTYVVDNTYDVIITVATTYRDTTQTNTLAQVLAPIRMHGTWTFSKWTGKKVAFMGDSITYGTGVSNDNAVYWRRLSEMLGFSSVTGLGVAGSCWSVTSDYGTGHSPISQRWDQIPTDADLVMIFAGTNDWGHSSVLGTVADTTDVSTCGAVATAINGVITANPDVRLAIISPLHRWGFVSSASPLYDNMENSQGHTLEDYADAIKETAAAYGIPVIDGFATGINPRVTAFHDAYVTDGLHPNDNGHGLLANALRGPIEAL